MINAGEIKSQLIGSTFIRKVYYFDEIESTNEFAKTLTDNDVLIVADYQSKGRGRHERNWVSEKNSNLTFTIKKHFDIAGDKIQFVNFYNSYILFAAIDNFLRAQNNAAAYELSIKWPNDILLNGKKICGILAESILPKNDFILGSGINVNQENFPEEISNSAASLKNILHYESSCTDLLITIIKMFDSRLELLINENYNMIYKLWRENNHFMGKSIVFVTNGGVERSAQIIDFLQDGGLKLRTENKEIVYYSGDIKILGAS